MRTSTVHMTSRLLLILIAAGGYQPLFAARQITVKQLESIAASAHDMSDGKIATEIEGLELTERLSQTDLSRCMVNLPGLHSKRAFLVLADQSAFLDPPAAEIPALPEPDLATQRKMMALTADYVTNAMHHLPNFFARRVTTSFENDLSSHTNLHHVGTYRAVVSYRDGAEKQNATGLHNLLQGLTTSGEFGPILGTALVDAAVGNLTWSHWEQGEQGAEAVFRYSVAANESHYIVENQPAAYHGEIAIDPSDGAILRLVLLADLQPGNELVSADIVVEYGPVEIGGTNYICPVKGVAFSQVRQLQWLNDVVFEQYHLFRSNVQILPGFSEAP